MNRLQQKEWSPHISDWTGYDSEFSNHPGHDTTAEEEGMDEMLCAGSIGPYSVVILSQDR
jgi:hypothetical protein